MQLQKKKKKYAHLTLVIRYNYLEISFQLKNYVGPDHVRPKSYPTIHDSGLEVLIGNWIKKWLI